MNKDKGFELSNAYGISGHEKNVKKIIQTYLNDYIDEFTEDKIGSLIGIKKGLKSDHKIMLAAHMDEVGFIIKDIDDKGFIKFTPVGGWWPHVILGQRVRVINNEGKNFVGVVGSTAPHVLPKEKRDQVMEIKEMFIDLGATSKDEVLANNIKIGDMIVPDSIAMDMLNDDFVLGKAWDNRIGCLMLIEIMEQLKNKKHEFDVYAVATVQEEIGLKGAKTSATKINPDIALALDTGIAGDTPGSDAVTTPSKLGNGPQYTIMDAGMIIHNGLKNFIEQTAIENNINLQPEILMGGATDAGSINLVHSGVITTCISLATRYLHAHNSIISKKDFDEAVILIVKMIEKLNSKELEKIRNNG